ncbi:hypothetical protein P7C70_g9299, partial [Phenoliferia sp. Uapishka_3]
MSASTSGAASPSALTFASSITAAPVSTYTSLYVSTVGSTPYPPPNAQGRSFHPSYYPHLVSPLHSLSHSASISLPRALLPHLQAGTRVSAAPTATPGPAHSPSTILDIFAWPYPFVDSSLSLFDLRVLLTNISTILSKPVIAEHLHREGIRSVKAFINFMFLPDDWIDNALVKCGPGFTKVVRVILLEGLRRKRVDCNAH